MKEKEEVCQVNFQDYVDLKSVKVILCIQFVFWIEYGYMNLRDEGLL